MKTFHYPSRKDFYRNIGKTIPIKFDTFESERDWGTILGTKDTLKLIRSFDSSIRINQGKDSDINIFDANKWSLLLTGRQSKTQPMSTKERIKWLKTIAESNGYKLEVIATNELESFGSEGRGIVYEIQFIFYQKKFKPIEKKRSGEIIYNWDKWLEAVDFLDKKIYTYSGWTMRTREPNRIVDLSTVLLENMNDFNDILNSNSSKFPVNYKINGNYQTMENFRYELEQALNRNNLEQAKGIALKINTYAGQLKNDMLAAKENIATWKSVIKRSVIRSLGTYPRNLNKYL